MPRERGKSRRGPTYYSQVGRHKCTGPTSLSPLPGSSSGRSPRSGQNWCEDAQTEFRPSNSEHFYGGCIVEEEIPPNWEEIPPNLQKTTMEQRPSTGTSIPLNSPEPAMTGCIVEEEIPPLMKDYCKNSVDANDEDPRIKWGDCWSEEETHRETYTEEQVHPALGSHNPPSSCRLTEDHLVLIFEMRRDLAEKLHNQHILNKHLDVLVRLPVKRACENPLPDLLSAIRLQNLPGWMPGFASCLVSLLLISLVLAISFLWKSNSGSLVGQGT
jgi:hypothetical protein